MLGPLLFLLFVNEIPEIVQSDVKMFADDTKVWKVLKEPKDSQTLQDDINLLKEWSQTWLLKFNASKCKTMHIGRGEPNQYFMDSDENGIPLERITKEKDLGVWLSDDLKPANQCKAAAGKATGALRQIKNSFMYITKDSFQILYNTYVRPHLEYCVQAWNPYYRKDIQRLERIQRRATKLVRGLEDLTYEERLVELDLYSLERRRVRGDLIELHKMFHKENYITADTFVTLATDNHRGHKLKLFKPRCRTLLRQKSFSQRIIDSWNALPPQVVQVRTVAAFKAALDKHWKRSRYGQIIGL